MPLSAAPAHPAFARYTRGVLAFNVAVVLWAAYVRASGSGAGCGRHWPACNGRVVPLLQSTKEMVEFAHRISSGLALLLVVGMLVWALRRLPAGHPARGGAIASMVLMVMEALLGAGLVLLRLVENDASKLRAISMAAHLTNTLFLLGAITLTCWWAAGGARIRLRGNGRRVAIVAPALAATVVVAVSGAVTALGDTLFPAGSLAAGLRQDLSPTAHFLIRLRILHPAFAIATGVLVVFTGYAVRRARTGAATARLSRVLVALFFAQLAAGAVNVVLLAPTAMQILHLLLADCVWIALVLTAASALSEDAAPAAGGAGSPAAEAAATPARSLPSEAGLVG
ncbi:MAG TPA: COX15/CtaA family protein [Longimicrobiaceae bacterium]|nr:COX15/CtaA family protein [Longimicrobiaceae bacterium]